MNTLIAVLVGVILLYLIGRAHRGDEPRLEQGTSGYGAKDVSKCYELVFELRCEAIMTHPKCRDYYCDLADSLGTRAIPASNAEFPLINHRQFRVVSQGSDMLWSDFHNTFVSEFDARGKILGGAVLGPEPTVRLRLFGSSFQLFLISQDQLSDDRATLLAEFPVWSIRSFSVGVSDEETRENLGSVVREVTELGFKWCTLDNSDAFEDETGEMELYDPNDGYIGFSNPWVRVWYKESPPSLDWVLATTHHEDVLKKIETCEMMGDP